MVVFFVDESVCLHLSGRLKNDTEKEAALIPGGTID